MFIIRNAIKNITRYINRYIIFGILLIIIYSSAYIVVMTYNLSIETIENIKDVYGGIFKLRYQLTDMAQHEFLRNDDVKEIKYCNFKAVLFNKNTQFIYDGNDISELYYPLYAFVVSGYNMNEDNIFNNPDIPINVIQGRLFEKDNECIITQKTFNSLKKYAENITIGDEITLLDERSGYSNTYKIVGITETFVGDLSDNRENPFVLYTTMEGAYYPISMDQTSDGLYVPGYMFDESDILIKQGYEAHFILNSYKDANAFRITVATLTDYKNTIEYVKEGFTDMLKPLDQTAETCSTFILIFIICGAMVVSMMATILLSERKYEIGVLYSMGMNKPIMSISFIIELLFFNIVTLAGSYIIGIISSVIISRSMPVDSEIVINYGYILIDSAVKVSLTSLGLNIIVSLLSLLIITQSNPAKILRSRY